MNYIVGLERLIAAYVLRLLHLIFERLIHFNELFVLLRLLALYALYWFFKTGDFFKLAYYLTFDVYHPAFGL